MYPGLQVLPYCVRGSRVINMRHSTSQETRTSKKLRPRLSPFPRRAIQQESSGQWGLSGGNDGPHASSSPGSTVGAFGVSARQSTDRHHLAGRAVVHIAAVLSGMSKSQFRATPAATLLIKGIRWFSFPRHQASKCTPAAGERRYNSRRYALSVVCAGVHLPDGSPKHTKQIH
jgi:hypothetical protein